MGLGKRLEAVINSRGLKVTQVASMANVSASTIYSIIDRDNKKIDIDVLIRICKALDVSTDYILQSDENTSSSIQLNNHEQDVIIAYRNNPDIQPAVDRLLLLDTPEKSIIYRAAKSSDNHPPEIVETTKDFSKIPPTNIKL